MENNKLLNTIPISVLTTPSLAKSVGRSALPAYLAWSSACGVGAASLLREAASLLK